MSKYLKRLAKERRQGRRGSAVVFMILLMSMMATGMVATMGMLSGVQTQNSEVILKRNTAYYSAEAGIQAAVWNMNNNSSWINTLPATATLPNGCTYTVSVLGNSSWPSAPVTFLSVGKSSDGTVISQASITVTSTVVVPGLAVGAGLSDSGTLTVAGSVDVAGDVTRSGTMTITNVSGMATSDLAAMGKFSSSGTFNVPGDILFNGSVNTSGTVNASGSVQSGSSISHSGTWNVTGTSNAFDSPNLSITPPTVDTATLASMAASGGSVISGGGYSNLTIDFTKAPNGIVCIDGNVSLSGTTVIKGTGTLLVQGTFSVSGSLGSAGTPAPVNIVTTGNASLSATLYLNGCFCVGGALSKSGTTSINGDVVVQQSVSGSGNIAITYTTPPWFIHYSGTGSGGSSISTTNFSGATY